MIRDEHYPPRPDHQGERAPRANNTAEAAFLALGQAAASCLTEAAAAGSRRIRVKMADAVALAKLRGAEDDDRALGTAAIAGRFAEGNLLAILDHQTSSSPGTDSTTSPALGCW